MPKMPIYRIKDSKKGVPRFALVAFRDLLECHVYTTKELSGPKSMGTGVTVKANIYGDVLKGTIVSMTDNETYLKKQSESFDVSGFFGFSKRRRSLSIAKDSHSKKNVTKPVTEEPHQQLTSTPASTKPRRLSVKHLPSPIKSIKSISRVISFTSHSTSDLSTAASIMDNIDDVSISLIEASYEDSACIEQSNLNTDNKNLTKSLFTKDIPNNKVDMSMNFSSFSSTIDSLQCRINPLIGSTINIPDYQSTLEIPSHGMAQHLGVSTDQTVIVAPVDVAKEATNSLSKTEEMVSASTQQSCLLPVSKSPVAAQTPSDPSSRVTANTARNIDVDVYLDAFFQPTAPCSLSSTLESVTKDFDNTFNNGGRSETTVILHGASSSDTDESTSTQQQPVSGLNESGFPPGPPTPVTKSPGCPAQCNIRMYDLDSEGDVHMMTIPDNKIAATSTAFDMLKSQNCSYLNSSNKENVVPIPHDIQIEADYDKFLQITPAELFYGLMLRSDFPPRMDNESLFIDSILLHLKSVSLRPEVFARNLMYRMFTLAELQRSSVYGRGFTHGQRNIALNADKIRLIRELTFVLYSDVRFSWRNCVLWMDKSIKYVSKLV